MPFTTLMATGGKFPVLISLDQVDETVDVWDLLGSPTYPVHVIATVGSSALIKTATFLGFNDKSLIQLTFSAGGKVYANGGHGGAGGMAESTDLDTTGEGKNGTAGASAIIVDCELWIDVGSLGQVKAGGGGSGGDAGRIVGGTAFGGDGGHGGASGGEGGAGGEGNNGQLPFSYGASGNSATTGINATPGDPSGEYGSWGVSGKAGLTVATVAGGKAGAHGAGILQMNSEAPVVFSGPSLETLEAEERFFGGVRYG